MSDPDKPDPVPLLALPPASTSIRIIRLVVIGIMVLAGESLTVLSAVIIFKIVPDPVILTAYVGITNYLIGALTGLLINTRTQPSGPISQDTIPEVKVVNKPDDPVPTTTDEPPKP